MGNRNVQYDDVAKCVDEVIKKLDKKIIFGMPLALGKPVSFVNELYRRAKEDPTIDLTILTALALEKPTWSSDLERRMLEPLVGRIFEGVPDFEYMLDFRAGKMPSNIRLLEFFNKAGGYMNNDVAQQNHLNSNYTHVIRDAMDYGVNLFGQLICKKTIDGQVVYSMGCNTDITIEAIRRMREAEANGEKMIVVGEVNENLPFMYGDALVGGETYDYIVENDDCNCNLFGPPKESVSPQDYMVGLNVSSLIKDGGSLQIGIGALGDAIVAALQMRQDHNDEYINVLGDIGNTRRYEKLIDALGGTGTFEQGLYGSSEMLVDGFIQLYNSGILKRRVYESAPIQRLLNQGTIEEKITPEILDLLEDNYAIHSRLKEKDFKFLQKFGILKDGLTFEDGYIVNGEAKIFADLNNEESSEYIKKNFLGDKLKGGIILHGAFFIGPRSFYDDLNKMSEEERQQFAMSGVDTVNQLYGNEELRSLQRKDGRFVNAGLMASISGAITSDALENGRVISGIGGQYNFVSMAHALEDGRLIMMIRSTRGSGKNTVSNIVFNYGHCSIPKHLRDIVVTEYGVADLRGKPDRDVIAEMLTVTDSRFQDGLLEQAKKVGKIEADYQIPEEFRNNTPEKLEGLLKPYKDKGHFKPFPFGTDVTDEEIAIGGSLRAFKAKAAESKLNVIKGIAGQFMKGVPENSLPYLKRMDLENPSGMKEKIMQKVVLHALESNGKI